MTLRSDLNDCLKDTSIITEEVKPKIESLIALVKDGVIQRGSAVLHFKQWLKDHEKYYERVRKVNEDTEFICADGSKYHRTKRRVEKGANDRDRRYYSVNADVYGAINTDSFGGFKG